MADKVFNLSHYLMGVRLDNFLRLLTRAGWKLELKRLPQTALIGLTSLVLSPFALVEKLVCAAPVAATKVKKDPVFVIGCWRSGTTYLQNLLTRDPQFAWADPVNTALFSNSLLLGWLLKGAVGAGLKGARPMDNVQYQLDLPMEETFAVANFTPWCLDHLLAFPVNYEDYIKAAFVEDLSPKDRQKWRKAYDYMVRKLTMLKGGKQLLFKSPDNTCRLEDLLEMYPGAKFINIHRDPYVTVRSAVHMFNAQMDMLRLSRLPEVEDIDELIEDVIIGLFERMYQMLFRLEDRFAPGQLVNVSYEDFMIEPEAGLREIYDSLGLEAFEEALPAFRAFIDSQKSYQKNKHEIPLRLRQKIESRLGFYFDRYGYEMQKEVSLG